MPPGALMAKTGVPTVKITDEMWQQLKLIQAATGEKMNRYVERVLGPSLAKDAKKALELLNKQQDKDRN